MTRTDNRTNEPTPNPTAEQIVEEALNRIDLYADEMPKAVVSALRAHGMLSEGAPTEAQARAVRKLDNVQAILAGAQASVTDAVRELSLASAALMAAQGAASQADGSECDRDRMGICKRCGMGWDVRKVLDGDFACPVTPSSGVDEDALRPFLKNLIFQYNQERVTLKTATRYLAEWLKGKSG